MTAKYPYSIVGAADMPVRLDGAVIYGQHMNLVQDEIIAIETLLGLGRSATDGVRALLDGGFSTLVERLTDLTNRVVLADQHRAAANNVHGITGNVVGTTDTQTLTNKTLTNPTLTGTVTATSVRVLGDVVFAGNVTIEGKLTLLKAPSITDFTNAQHDHSTAAKGGPIPISSITNLQSTLDGKAPVSHTHTKAQITDFAHDLNSASHTGTLPVAKVSGLGTAATMNVPTTAHTAATLTQVVRGDDPRLSDTRAPKAHASSHASNGADPITPASIGAARASHTHVRADITDLASMALTAFAGNLPESRITNLTTDLANKLPLHGTADNAVLVGGHRITVSTSQPGGTPNTNDIWIKV